MCVCVFHLSVCLSVCLCVCSVEGFSRAAHAFVINMFPRVAQERTVFTRRYLTFDRRNLGLHHLQGRVAVRDVSLALVPVSSVSTGAHDRRDTSQ